MKDIGIGRIAISAPFFALGVGFVGGALWIGCARLLEGFTWLDDDSFIVGSVIVLLIFGGALIQFGVDALLKGHSQKGKSLISPVIFYFLGLLFVVPGVWSSLYGSTNAIAVAAIGIAFCVYGFRLSRKRSDNRER